MDNKFFLSNSTKELFRKVFMLREYLTAGIDAGGELINLTESSTWASERPDNKFTGKDFHACQWLKFGNLAINFWQLELRSYGSDGFWSKVDCGWYGGDVSRAIYAEREAFEKWREEFLKDIPEIKPEIVNDKFLIPVMADNKRCLCPKCKEVLLKVRTRQPVNVYWWGNDEAYSFNYGFFCPNCGFESTVEVNPYDDEYENKEQFWQSLEEKLLAEEG